MKANPIRNEAASAVDLISFFFWLPKAHKHATNYNQFENDSKAVEPYLIPFGQTHAQSMERLCDALRFESFLFSLYIY